MWYDVLVVAILVFFAVRGAAKGVVWQLAGIAGIILCFAFADGISAALGPSVNLEPPLNHWVVLFGAYLGFSFLSFGVARALNEWIEKAQMKEFNQHLGAVFGLLKGVLLCLILTFLIVTVSEDARQTLLNSHSGRYAAIIMDRLHPILPAKLHEALEDYIHKLDSPDLPLKHSRDHSHAGGPSTNLGEPAALPGQSSTSPPVPANDFWSQVQGLLGEEAKRVVLSAMSRAPNLQSQTQLQDDLLSLIQSTPADQLPALKQQLLQTGAADLERFLWEMKTFQPTPTPAVTPDPTPIAPTPLPQPTPTPTPTLTAERSNLVRAIASLYSTIPTVRQGIEQQIEGLLEGLPPQVALAVLADWKADIYAEKPDPDPGTSMTSSVEQRIVRQLGKAGISLEQLSAPLRQRLQAADSQGTGSPL